MKKLSRILLIMLLLFAVVFAAVSCFEPKTYAVKYIALEGGYIEGNKNQSVEKGNDATKVEAKSYDGFVFAYWSDSETNPTRQDKNIDKDKILIAAFAKVEELIELNITYIAGEGGYIDGEENQPIPYGQNAEEVTARNNDGYEFVRWSDGDENPVRADKNIKYEFTVTAIFRELSKTFEYVYNDATSNNTEESIELKYHSLYTIQLEVPKRDHFNFIGWYLDADFGTQVADEQGNVTIDYSIFENEASSLYARFVVIEEIRHKVLLVFVNEAYAVLKDRDGVEHAVNFKMSQFEKEILMMYANLFTKCLNKMMGGLVIFEVDTYFTTVPIGNESFKYGTTSWGKYAYTAMADRIPEVAEMSNDYLSVLTTVGMNDYGAFLHAGSGTGSKKYGTIQLESIINRMANYDVSQETAFDFESRNVRNWWKVNLDTYMHEFAHTLEMYSRNFYEYHVAIVDYLGGYSGTIDEFLAATKAYLLNQIEVDGEKVGIPYDFWKDGIHYTLEYSATEGGTIDGNMRQYIRYSGSSEYVTAKPKEGYKFVKWSDGYSYARRGDGKNTSVTAIFEEITRLFWYYINNGDDGFFIDISYHSLDKAVFMVPQMDGFIFDGWYLGNLAIQVSDKDGKITIGNEIFDLPPQYLYLHPKWIPVG